MARLLVGPLTANPVYNNATLLGDFYGEPDILTFGPTSGPDPRGVDVLYDLQQDTFLDMLQRLPLGWEPDLVLWWDLAFQPLVAGIAQCPYPLAVVAGDWNLTALTLRYALGLFDFVLGDLGLIHRLQALGHHNQAWFRAYSFDPAVHFPVSIERCYDVVFIGNLNDRIHARRSQYLQQLATLGNRYRIHLANGIFGPDYRRLLNQSRLVFNHSVRGEMNMRAYEAPACGTALLMEADNLEISQVLVPQRDYMPYQDDLITQIEALLVHPKQLDEMAQAGLAAIRHESYTDHFAYLLKHLVPQAIAAFQGVANRPFNQQDPLAQQQAEIRQWWATQQPDGLRRLWQAHTQAPLDLARATVLSASQDTSLALELCGDWEMAEPHNPLVKCHRAYLLQQQGQFDLASQIWQAAIQGLEEQALHLTPALQWPGGYLAWLPLALEQRGLDVQPDFKTVWQAWSHFNQGLCCLELGQTKMAITLFEQALALAPDLRETWFYLGQAQERSGESNAAYHAYQRANESGVMLVSLWQSLARLHLVLGESEKALAVLQVAQTLLGPKVPTELAELVLIAQVTRAWQAQEWPQWAAGMAQIEDVTAQLMHWGLTPYLPFAVWCKPVLVQWQVSPPEKPLLLTHWRQTDETSELIVSDSTEFLRQNEGLLAQTRQRIYQPQGQTEQQWGWLELPFLFPTVAAAEGQLEELNTYNWLLLWEPQQTVCGDFLATWIAQCDVTHTCFLLASEMSATELERLEELAKDSVASLVLLSKDSLATAEQRQLLQAVQVVVGSSHGNSPYYWHWALWLAKPVLLLEHLGHGTDIADPLWLDWKKALQPWHEGSWTDALTNWPVWLNEKSEQARHTSLAMQGLRPKLEQRWRQTWWLHLQNL